MGELLARADFWSAERQTIEAQGWGHTGEVFARLEDGWVSVRGGLPGEQLVVRIEPGQREGARRIWAELLEVERPSPERVDPGCGQVDRCRGCQLRHASLESERAYKREALREVVERYAGLEVSQQPDVVEWIGVEVGRQQPGVRIRSNLRYRRTSAGVELGLGTFDGGPLVSMAACPALAPCTRGWIAQLTEILDAMDPAPADRSAGGGPVLEQVRLIGLEQRAQLVFEISEGLSGEAWSSLESALLGGFAGQEVGLFLEQGESRRALRGPDRLPLELAPGVELALAPGAWSHATLEPARALYGVLPDWLEARREDRLADIGCGMGTISLLMSEHLAGGLGLDANREAIEAAQQAAGRMGLGSRFGFEAGAWEKGLRRWCMRGERAQVATINPMREPLGERALRYLEPLGIERLLYLGPSIVSAARDLGVLLELGWRLRRLAVADLHPATYHAMAVMALER